MDFLELTQRFFSLADANVRFVIAGTVLLGIVGGMIGSFAFLQRKALVGDALSHAALPGVCLAFIITGIKDQIILLVGAGITAWIGAQSVNWIVRRTRIKQDAALGLTLSVYFGLGVTLLTYIQSSGAGNQSGLDKFIFGQAASIVGSDLVTIGLVGLVILAALFLFFKEFKLLTFDENFSASIGRPTRLLQFLMTLMITLTVTIGLQTVGVALIAAMLITPAAGARQWTSSLSSMVIVSAVMGALAGIVGAYISFLAPQLPTGPWIVVTAGILFALSLLLAPERGMLAQWRRRYQARRKIIHDHLLKAMYRLANETSPPQPKPSLDVLSRESRLSNSEAASGLSRLTREALVNQTNGTWSLTSDGSQVAARIVKLHRLWEVYLSIHLSLPPDHVHRDADEIEHIITPEMEKRLEEILNRPSVDPHQSPIPYQNAEEEGKS